MTDSPLTIAYLTAGAAGMICGSCLRDNTLAAALQKMGCDVHLIPTYTPIRTDEVDVSEHKVFFGGINVYLQERFGFFRHLPAFLDRWLDWPWLIKLASSRGIEVEARQLGALTVSVLRGEQGHLRKEVVRLVRWLRKHVRPDLVNLSNMLIAGCVPRIKEKLNVPVLVTLQGDDLFLNDLIEPYRSQAFAELARLAQHIDGYLVFSNYYADYMANLLKLPRERFHIVRMGINTRDFETNGAVEPSPVPRPPTVGYLARICPAKGFHLLADAFIALRDLPGMEQARWHAAGWLGKGDERFFRDTTRKLKEHGLDDSFHYAGVVDRPGKIAFLRGIDVLSVPTTYHEPKGIFVLEALATGVPVVQPAHGAFPELLSTTGGGKLVAPDDPRGLAEALHSLLIDSAARISLGQLGRHTVLEQFHAQAMAAETLDVYRRFVK